MTSYDAASTKEPSDEQLAELVARMRRIRRQNRLAHVVAGCALVVGAVTVWCIYTYVFFDGVDRAPGRWGMILASFGGGLPAVLLYSRLRSKEVIDDDA